MSRIEPVPLRRFPEAALFLAGAGQRGPEVLKRARTYEHLARGHGSRYAALWWARRGRTCVAAALVAESAGRTGMLIYSRPEAAEVDAESLAQLVRQISQDCLQQGLALVQSMTDPAAEAEAAMLRSAGFELLAELSHLKLELPARLPPIGDQGLSWRTYGQFSDKQLADVISATYAGSLDVPALVGVRRLPDIIAGHKASGLFQPDSWWVLDADGTAAGCILMNDALAAGAAEVVYLGVLPAFRGRGYGRLMVRKAAQHAAARGLSRIKLAMDTRNVYAGQVYEAEGFRPENRRLAFGMIGRRGPFRNEL